MADNIPAEKSGFVLAEEFGDGAEHRSAKLYNFLT
jgi:hypothetical protein